MNKNRCFYAFLLFCCMLIFSPAVNGQVVYSTQNDSLRKVITTKKGVDRISAQLALSLNISTINVNEAEVLANAALQASKRAGNDNLKMRSYFVMGRVFTEMRNNERSLAYLDTALQMAKALNDNWYIGEILYRTGVDKHRMGNYLEALKSFNSALQACIVSDNFRTAGSAYSMMGTIFRLNGTYDRAIEYIIKSKLNYEKANYTEGSAWAAYLLGRIYADLKLPEKAFEYFNEALKIYQKVSTDDGNQNGIAICYEQLAMLNIEAQNFKQAREEVNKALKIYTVNKSKFGISNGYKHLGVIEYLTGNYTRAEDYFTQSLKIKKEVNDILSIPGIYEYMGLNMIEKGQIKEGFKTMNQGLDLAIKNNQKKIQLDIYSKLTKAYLNRNDYKNAIACQNKQIEIQDFILSGGANVKTEQLQAFYEIDEKNRQIDELQKQNEINALKIERERFFRNIMIIGILVVILITTIVILFYNRLRQNNRELNEINAAKDKLFAIIAHDLRGPTSSLTSLLEYINSAFDEFSAEELKETLSTLYKSAKNVNQLLENLLLWAQSQVARIEYQPTKLKLTEIIQQTLTGLNQSATKKEIDIKIEIDNSIFVFADPNMVQTILRNILSNAIKFTNRGGMIVAQSALPSQDMAMITITDNGVGIEKSKLEKIFDLTNTYHTKGTENEMSTGLGLILIKDFVAQNKGTLNIESEKGKGTTVSFTLPLYQESAS